MWKTSQFDFIYYKGQLGTWQVFYMDKVGLFRVKPPIGPSVNFKTLLDARKYVEETDG